MRVDFVITELNVGGAERCLTELAIGLAQSGDEVRVFSLGALPEGNQRGLVDRLQRAGIPISSGVAKSNSQVLAVYRRLKRWFAESQPQVCQTFMYHANVLGTFAAQSSGVDVRVGGLRVAELRRSAVRSSGRQLGGCNIWSASATRSKNLPSSVCGAIQRGYR